jgi:PAS domain S-box-containing protein
MIMPNPVPMPQGATSPRQLAAECLLTPKGAKVYRALIEQMSEGALTLAEGVILYANHSLARMIKMPLDWVVGARLQPWVAPESQPTLKSLLRSGATGSRRQELELLASDGTRVPVQVSVNRLHFDGTPDVICMVATDLTPAKKQQNLPQFTVIKGQAQASHDILKDITFPWPIAQIVMQDHERLDGTGYQHGLNGDATLFEAPILGVADVIEPLSAHRPIVPARESNLRWNRSAHYAASTSTSRWWMPVWPCSAASAHPS